MHDHPNRMMRNRIAKLAEQSNSSQKRIQEARNEMILEQNSEKWAFELIEGLSQMSPEQQDLFLSEMTFRQQKFTMGLLEQFIERYINVYGDDLLIAEVTKTERSNKPKINLSQIQDFKKTGTIHGAGGIYGDAFTTPSQAGYYSPTTSSTSDVKGNEPMYPRTKQTIPAKDFSTFEKLSKQGISSNIPSADQIKQGAPATIHSPDLDPTIKSTTMIGAEPKEFSKQTFVGPDYASKTSESPKKQASERRGNLESDFERYKTAILKLMDPNVSGLEKAEIVGRGIKKGLHKAINLGGAGVGAIWNMLTSAYRKHQEMSKGKSETPKEVQPLTAEQRDELEKLQSMPLKDMTPEQRKRLNYLERRSNK